jgi:hypothetical protein
MNTGLPTAPLASGLLRAGGSAVDNPCNGTSTTRSQSTYLSPDRVQTRGATSRYGPNTKSNNDLLKLLMIEWE